MNANQFQAALDQYQTLGANFETSSGEKREVEIFRMMGSDRVYADIWQPTPGALMETITLPTVTAEVVQAAQKFAELKDWYIV